MPCPRNSNHPWSIRALLIHKYRVKARCLSCNKPITRRHAVFMVTQLPEDRDQSRTYLLHEACQSAAILEMPFSDDPQGS